MRGYSRVVSSLILSCVVTLLSSCERPTDCYGFLDESPTFLLFDRLGDEGVPYYDTSNITLNLDTFASLPSCGALEGLTPEEELRISNVVAGDVGVRCGRQSADADVSGFEVPYGLATGLETDFLADSLRTGQQALLLGAPAASVDGCVGEWVVSVDAWNGDALTTDPGEGASPPWTITRLFRPGTGTGCAAVESCLDIFTARIVLDP